MKGTKVNWLGKSEWSGDIDFRGQMAEVRVWNTQRTEEQIRANMLTPMSGKESGLQALWNFTDGSPM